MLPEGERPAPLLDLRDPWGSAQLAATRMLPPGTNGSFLVTEARGYAVTPLAHMELD